MSSSQVTAGIALLKKVLPDLSQTDITTDGDKIEMPTQVLLAAARDDSND